MRYAVVLFALGCANEPETTLLQTCSQPGTTFVAGDAQGDGSADLSDAVAVLRTAMDGAREPGCIDAIDLIVNARADADDATSLLLALYEGTFPLPILGREACAGAEPWGGEPCADVALTWTVDGREATLHLASSAPVEAWSLGVEADGCAIEAADVEGTVAADRHRDDVGLRDLGYDATLLRDGVVTQAVVLGMADAITLPDDGTPQPILRVTTDGPCTLTATAGSRTHGLPVRRIAVVDGRAFPLPEAVIDVP